MDILYVPDLEVSSVKAAEQQRMQAAVAKGQADFDAAQHFRLMYRVRSVLNRLMPGLGSFVH